MLWKAHQKTVPYYNIFHNLKIGSSVDNTLQSVETPSRPEGKESGKESSDLTKPTRSLGGKWGLFVCIHGWSIFVLL